MLKAHIIVEDHPAIFDLPHDPLEVEEFLSCSGNLYPYADLCLCDEESRGPVLVSLIAETVDDDYLQSIFAEDAGLSTVNTVCGLYYGLPAETQNSLINKMASGRLSNENELLHAIKDMQPAAPYSHAIIFSRVRLWTDTGEQCEFFMGGVPECYEDIEDHEDCIDFKEFLEQLPNADAEEITAYVTAFTEGEGDPLPARQEDIERIYRAIADVDLDTITGWNWHSENGFTFHYGLDESFSMKGIE